MRIPSVGDVEFVARLDDSLGICFRNAPLQRVVGKHNAKGQRGNRNPDKGYAPPRTLDGVFHDADKEPNRTDDKRELETSSDDDIPEQQQQYGQQPYPPRRLSHFPQQESHSNVSHKVRSIAL